MKMDFFYDRVEKGEYVEITLLGLPFLNMLFWFVLFISILSRGALTSIAFFAFCAGLMFYFLACWKVIFEINRAMRNQGILMMGSQFSLRHPIKIVIRKGL